MRSLSISATLQFGVVDNYAVKMTQENTNFSNFIPICRIACSDCERLQGLEYTEVTSIHKLSNLQKRNVMSFVQTLLQAISVEFSNVFMGI